MPYKVEKIPINSPFLDNRTKLLPCQREMVIYWHNRGKSQRQLSRLFKVSRRLIQFIIDPTKKEKDLENREKRGGSKKYYKKEKHRESIKKHRRYKDKEIKQFLIPLI